MGDYGKSCEDLNVNYMYNNQFTCSSKGFEAVYSGTNYKVYFIC